MFVVVSLLPAHPLLLTESGVSVLFPLNPCLHLVAWNTDVMLASGCMFGERRPLQKKGLGLEWVFL